MRRVALAVGTFVVVTTGSLAALTAVAYGLLGILADFKWNDVGFGFAVVIYSPTVGLFLVVSVGIGLFASHRSYYHCSYADQ